MRDMIIALSLVYFESLPLPMNPPLRERLLESYLWVKLDLFSCLLIYFFLLLFLPNYHFSFAGVGSSAPKPASLWTIQFRLLRFHPHLWSQFIAWGNLDKYWQARSPSGALSDELKELLGEVTEHFHWLAHCAQRGQILTEELALLHSYKKPGSAVWAILDSPLRNGSAIASMENSLASFKTEIDTLIRVLSSLMPESDEFNRVSSFKTHFATQFFGAVQSLLGFENGGFDELCERMAAHFSEAEIARAVRIQPLPQTLCSALDWLVFGMESALFRAYWRDHCECEPGVPVAVETVALQWAEFQRSLLDKDLCLDILEV